jgi:hypothetical protein
MTTEHLPQPVPRPEPQNLAAAIDGVERALASSKELPALTKLHAGIRALEQLAKSMNAAREEMNRLAECRIRGERQMGQLLLDSVARGGHGSNSTRHSSKTGGSSHPLPAGISHFQSSQWQYLARIPEAQFEAYLSQAKREGWDVSVKALRRFVRTAAAAPPRPATPRADAPRDDLAWLLDAARRILDERIALTAPSPQAVPAARELRADGARDLLLDLRRSQQPQAWLKAVQRHLAGGEDRQAIVALHVRALALVASSRAICVPTSPPVIPECVVAYHGRKVHAFGLVFREVGALLAPMQIA